MPTPSYFQPVFDGHRTAFTNLLDKKKEKKELLSTLYNVIMT